MGKWLDRVTLKFKLKELLVLIALVALSLVLSLFIAGQHRRRESYPVVVPDPEEQRKTFDKLIERLEHDGRSDAVERLESLRGEGR